MGIPDYYDWRAAEQNYNNHKFKWSNNMFISQLPEGYWHEVYDAVRNYLINEEGLEEDSEELDGVIDTIMDGQLWNLEDYIDLDDILGE